MRGKHVAVNCCTTLQLDPRHIRTEREQILALTDPDPHPSPLQTQFSLISLDFAGNSLTVWSWHLHAGTDAPPVGNLGSSQMTSNVKAKSLMLAISPILGVSKCCYIWCFCKICKGPIFFDFLGFFDENGINHRLREILDLLLIKSSQQTLVCTLQ